MHAHEKYYLCIRSNAAMARETCYLNTRRALCCSIGINAILFTALLVLQYAHDIKKDDDNSMQSVTEQFSAHASGQAKNYYSDFISVSNNTLCVECGYLGKNISAEETLYNQILNSKNGSQMCCLEDRSLARLARKVVSVKDQHEIESKTNWSCISEKSFSIYTMIFLIICQESYVLYFKFHFRN